MMVPDANSVVKRHPRVPAEVVSRTTRRCLLCVGLTPCRLLALPLRNSTIGGEDKKGTARQNTELKVDPCRYVWTEEPVHVRVQTVMFLP